MSKPAVKSLGVWGSVTSLWAIVSFLRDLPPDLLDDVSQTWKLIVAAVMAVVALLGRFKAKLPIAGLLFSKKDKKVNKSFGMFIVLGLALILNYNFSYADTPVITHTKVVSATPVLDTSAFAAGDTMIDTTSNGGDVEFTGALRDGVHTGKLAWVMMIDDDNQAQDVKLHLFSANPTVSSAENATLDIADGASGIDLYLCTADINVHESWNDNSVSYARNVGCMLETAQGVTSVWGVLESEGTGTYGASAVIIKLGIEQD